jgi:hypothetical protein
VADALAELFVCAKVPEGLPLPTPRLALHAGASSSSRPSAALPVIKLILLILINCPLFVASDRVVKARRA